MSAYSRDDFSRSTAASHHSGSLLHVQHTVHPAGEGAGEEERVFPEPSDDGPVTVGGKELCCLRYLLISSSCGQLLCFTSPGNFVCDFPIYRCKSVHRPRFLLHLSSPLKISYCNKQLHFAKLIMEVVMVTSF